MIVQQRESGDVLPKFKFLLSKEEIGPVTAISKCCGLLAVAIGQKVHNLFSANEISLYQVEGERTLQKKTMCQIELYCCSLMSSKNFIVAVDIYKGVVILVWKPTLSRLKLVARDTFPIESTSCSFLSYDSSLTFLRSDMQRNVQQYTIKRKKNKGKGFWCDQILTMR